MRATGLDRGYGPLLRANGSLLRQQIERFRPRLLPGSGLHPRNRRERFRGCGSLGTGMCRGVSERGEASA